MDCIGEVFSGRAPPNAFTASLFRLYCFLEAPETKSVYPDLFLESIDPEKFPQAKAVDYPVSSGTYLVPTVASWQGAACVSRFRHLLAIEHGLS